MGVKRGGVTAADRVLVVWVGSHRHGRPSSSPRARGADPHRGWTGARIAWLSRSSGLGADRTLLADAAAEEKVRDLTAGDGFDVVIDATRQRRRDAARLRLRRARRTLRPGERRSGRRHVLGPGVPQARDDALRQPRNAQPDDFAEVVRQMAAGKVPTGAPEHPTAVRWPTRLVFSRIGCVPRPGVIKANPGGVGSRLCHALGVAAPINRPGAWPAKSRRRVRGGQHRCRWP